MALAYYLITLWVPGGIQIQGSFTSGGRETVNHIFSISVSFTLTTIGYGDIVAVHRCADAGDLEGVVGQLFPAILIARLVSLQVQSKRGEKK